MTITPEQLDDLEARAKMWADESGARIGVQPGVTLQLVTIARAALAMTVARDAWTLAYTQWSEGEIDDDARDTAERASDAAESALVSVVRGTP